MQGSDKRFIIPVYQRNYDWKIENCKQLYDDLIKVVKKQRKSHFFGSIVSAHVNDSFNEFLIIDGQQRLTTISLLLLALYNIMAEGKAVPEKSNLPDRILKTYLIDEWQEDETRIKLKPVKNDQNAFGKLFGDKDEYIHDSNITINYQYFYDRIPNGEISVDELYDAICKLEIINIALSSDDNPQLIFESLNSTGLALSEGDKIRNYILMGLSTKLQNEYYEKYWNKIEVCTEYEVSAFIRDYLSIKQRSIPSINRVYITFKNYVDENEIDTEVLLVDLLSYAKLYQKLLNGHTGSSELNAVIYRLNRMEVTVSRPFLLQVLRMETEEKITSSETAQIFRIVETYVFRRNICSIPTNALNKIFVMLHNDIIRLDGTANNYFEKFKYILLSKKESGRFPDDKEFISAFETKAVYQMNSKNKAYIFERLENYDTVEDKDIYRHIDNGTYTIEHIMPQTLSPIWQDDLGEDYEEIHEVWLHRIANLTLTGYNSKYSNEPFLKKRDMDHGFVQSGLRMNTFIAQNEKWTLAELEKRNSMLMEQVIKIWPAVLTDYVPVERDFESISLEEDYDVTNRLIVKFLFRNTEYPVKNWVEMFEQIVRLMYEQDKSLLIHLAQLDRNDENSLPIISSKTEELREPIKIDESVYLEKNTSNVYKINSLRKLAKLYGVDESDIVFYLRDNNSINETDESEIEINNYRHKYWSYALPQIQEAHSDSKLFSNVTNTTRRWIAGTFGLGGFYLECNANHNQVKVVLCLSKRDKELNKSAFDFLYSKKNEIESKLGSEFTWWRYDDNKSSYVVHRLRDINLLNEADYGRMAEFHAEWSKKFYDTFVPLLKEWNESIKE